MQVPFYSGMGVLLRLLANSGEPCEIRKKTNIRKRIFNLNEHKRKKERKEQITIKNIHRVGHAS